MTNAILQIEKGDLRDIFLEFIGERENFAKAVAKNEDRLMDSAEVEAMLKVEKTSLWRWAKRGYLVPLKIGGKNRYRFSDVKKIMEGGK